MLAKVGLEDQWLFHQDTENDHNEEVHCQPNLKKVYSHSQLGDSAKGGLTQFWKHFTRDSLRAQRF